MREKMAMTPKRLYKYKGVDNNDDIDRIREIIVDSKIFFANSMSFNDPFDTRLDFDPECSKAEFKAKIEQMAKTSGHRISANELNRIVNNSYETCDTYLLQTLEALRQKFGIVCLTEINDSILMWSHYASGHKGICFEFIPPHPTMEQGMVLPMKYVDEYPIHKFYKINHREVIVDLLLLKSKEWEYEKEWRWLPEPSPPDDSREAGLRDFFPEMLTGVIYGCKADDALRDSVREFNGQRKNPVQLYQAVMKKRAFGLDIEPIV